MAKVESVQEREANSLMDCQPAIELAPSHPQFLEEIMTRAASVES